MDRLGRDFWDNLRCWSCLVSVQEMRATTGEEGLAFLGKAGKWHELAVRSTETVY